MNDDHGSCSDHHWFHRQNGQARRSSTQRACLSGGDGGEAAKNAQGKSQPKVGAERIHAARPFLDDPQGFPASFPVGTITEISNRCAASMELSKSDGSICSCEPVLCKSFVIILPLRKAPVN